MKLQNFGFSKKEEKIYLACLELGLAPVSVIAQKAKIKRTTVYEVIKNLCEKGFGEFLLKENVKFYRVIAPNKLYNHFKANLRGFQEELPHLNAIYNEITYKPKIRFYEGRKDIEKLYLDVIFDNKGKEFCNYFMPEQVFNYFSLDFILHKFADTPEFRQTKIRTITSQTNITNFTSEMSQYKNREMRVMKDENSFFKNEIYIYDDKVVTFSFDENFAFITQSQAVADTQKKIFDLAWHSADIF